MKIGKRASYIDSPRIERWRSGRRISIAKSQDMKVSAEKLGKRFRFFFFRDIDCILKVKDPVKRLGDHSSE
jgi:hypothetical protein